MTIALPSFVAPTRLRIPDLLRATDVAADHVLSGRYDHLMPVGGPPPGERWFSRLHGDDELDVWLISWVPERSTELHDHGGSLGALTVVSGALAETRWDGDALRGRRLEAGDQAGFPLGWVHDVVWAPDAARPKAPKPISPTLSVHAYSPPLTAMSFYEVTARNTLRRDRTELTDKPEGGLVPSRIDAVLESARSKLSRIEATDVPEALNRGALLVDIRPAAQRAQEGDVAAAMVIERNVLEWRCDPTSDARLPQATDDDVEWIVLCSEGYTSSLAAAALVDLGLHRATDVVGGYHALRTTGVLAQLD